VSNSSWGTPEEIERRRRIRVAVWAYAYEVLGEELAPDALFDAEIYAIQPKVSTGHDVLDKFFRSKRFSKFTGQWVHSHPELERVAATAKRWLAYKQGG